MEKKCVRELVFSTSINLEILLLSNAVEIKFRKPSQS